jgi:hypothetical protein
MLRGLSLWKDFTSELLRELHAMSPDEVKEFWSTPTKRTDCYLAPNRGMLPRMAEKVGMQFKREYLRIDGELCRDEGFPEIFVELENDGASVADSELEKLCYVRIAVKAPDCRLLR